MGTRGHINSYNLRQVAPDYNVYSPDYGKLIDVAANTIKTVANNEANQAKLANFQVDLNAKFMQKNYEINTKYQAEPDNPEREKEIKNAFDELANSYKVSPLLKQQWEQTKQKIYNGYVTYNSDWMLKQNVQNAQTNLETGRKNLLQNGYNLAASGADDGLIQLTYANGLDAIKKGSIHWLGEQTVNQALKDIHSDYAKCVLNGLTEYDPVQAYKILNTAPAYDNMNKYKKSVNPADYDTKLSDDEEKEFQAWVKKYKDKGIISPDEDFHDYDMRGFYKEFGKNWDDGVNERANKEVNESGEVANRNGLPRRPLRRTPRNDGGKYSKLDTALTFTPNDGDSNGDADSLEGGGVNSTDGKYHFPDKYKKPNHQTFSNESMYYNEKNAQYAGSWNEDGTFNPPNNPNVHPLINDLNDESAREELLSVAEKKMFQLQEKNAVQQLVGTFKDMNSQQYNKILNGEANYGEVKQFIESHPKLPKKSKEIIGDIYGIKMKSSYYIDDVTGKVKKIDERGTNSEIASLRSQRRNLYGAPLNPLEKIEKGQALENELHNLISFSYSGFDNNNKNANGKKLSNKQMHSGIYEYANRVAAMQGSIDAAYHSGVIDSKTRNHLMNSYINPVSSYLEEGLQNLDESSRLIGGEKLGYGRIRKYIQSLDHSAQMKEHGATDKDIENYKKDLAKQKLFAQNYYLDELNRIVQKTPNLDNIYNIEKLPAKMQREIYKTASENAILRAKRWTDKPELFFAHEYPQLYAIPSIYFRNADAAIINRTVAENTYKQAFSGDNSINLIDFAKNSMKNEIEKMAIKKRVQAGEMLHIFNTGGSAKLHRPLPKSSKEFSQRVNALGMTMQNFIDTAERRGLVNKNNPQGLIESIKKAHNEIVGKTPDWWNRYATALIELEAMKAGGK